MESYLASPAAPERVSEIPGAIPLQGFDFFRKERPEVFAANFTAPADGVSAYGLTSHTIFEAKNYAGEKHFTVEVNGKKRKLIATAVGPELIISNEDTKRIELGLTEASMRTALTSLAADRRPGSLAYQVSKKLCKDHATSSASSPLISGTIVNNFDASRTYDGFKLHLLLRQRQPFVNPFASGLEREHFLIGRVLDTDCVIIRLYGRMNETRNEVVNFFGSALPRP